MLMIMVVFVIMMVKMERADEKEHKQQSGERGAHGHVAAVAGGDRVGKQVQQGDPQHQAANEAEDKLHPDMR